MLNSESNDFFKKKLRDQTNPMVRTRGFTPINMINNGKCYEIAVAFVMIHIFKIYFKY